MKHANSILELSEYFFQISSKSIHSISSYTVSKLGRFLRHSVVCGSFAPVERSAGQIVCDVLSASCDCIIVCVTIQPLTAIQINHLSYH